MLWLAAAGKLVVLAAEEYEPALHTVRDERGIHLVALINGAAVILERVEEERGRFDPVSVLHGAVPPEFFRVRPDGRAALILGEVRADVGHAVEARPVGDGALAGAGAEAVGVADDPVGHKAAVGAAGFKEIIRIHLGIAFERRVAERHEVVEVHRAVFAADVHERAASVAARGIAENDEIALAGPILHFVIEDGAVNGLGAAVDIEDDGILFARFKAEGLQDEAVYLVTARSDIERLRRGDIPAAQRRIVEMRDAAACLVIQLLRFHIPERAEEHFAVFTVEAVNRAVAHQDGGDDAVLKLVQPCAVKARRDKVQRVAVHFERAAAAVADVAANRRADGLAVDGVGRDGERFVVELKEVAVRVHAELAVCGHDEQERLAERIRRNDKVRAAPDNAFLRARGKLHAVKIRAAEVCGAGAGHIEQAVVNGLPVLCELHIGDVEAFLRQAGEGLFPCVVVEETLIRAARIGAAVPPPGQLGDDLVVLVLLLAVKIGFSELSVAFIEVLKAGEG